MPTAISPVLRRRFLLFCKASLSPGVEPVPDTEQQGRRTLTRGSAIP